MVLPPQVDDLVVELLRVRILPRAVVPHGDAIPIDGGAAGGQWRVRWSIGGELMMIPSTHRPA